MKIHFNDLHSQWIAIKEEVLKELDNLFWESNFILGKQVKAFENDFANYIGTKFSAGVSNGTDAIKLAAKSLKLSGTTLVIIPANTYIATIFGMQEGIPNADFKLVDCDNYYQIDVDLVKNCVLINRSRYDNVIIVPVHLYGYTCDMQALIDIAQQYNCIVLEDVSQAHGAKSYDQTAGTYGAVSAFSLYPGKNLGAAGDAGIITTNNENYYDRILVYRNLGSIKKYEHIDIGYNHRLDTIQAIILKTKLQYLESWNEKRRQIVNYIENNLTNSNITLPKNPPYCLPVHHVYPVITENNKHFQDYLKYHNIEYGMHYPILIEETSMYKHLSGPNLKSKQFARHSTSLPIHPFMTDEHINYLINTMNGYLL